MRLYPLLLLLLFSAGLQAEPAASQEQNNTADLTRQLPAEEIRMLGSQSPFMVLQRNSLTAATKGTVILVADGNEHAASAKQIDILRQHLNEYGWNTLSVMPPPSEDLLHTSEALQQYQSALQQRLSAAAELASQQAGSIIVIAQGNSAAALNHLYAAGQLTEPAALVLLGAYLPDEQLNKALATAIASHQVPTLDINLQYDNRFVVSQLKLRRQLANKLFKPVYRQRLLSGSGYNNDMQLWVLQEIYGWLTSVGL
ncbi:MAG: alpha/beta hydrolase family protein [Gammaproteobacteria bacterium]|nr:alpha/beta hydrolase family protein [Gammaproteobacteria bacterium]MBU1557222.1 alpha/beta hydrolase family protein [Gammaproteobacteria bacterium]MBU2072155.1 alpha/beta hydrolase family protein [Gammaproteobacteria bacterium]MBU2182017.1 alpha/beta hydrolase family protein [Gammaproteobacteria bacterium]MBU2203860.1 alpha/beta hydrolase family protein [Gammaproteobacteria bacterium]